MKLYYFAVLTVLCLLINTNKVLSQTATTNVIYSGFQACGGCTVCGADYWCIGIHGSYCGDIPNCGTRTFFDPVPAGYVVTNVTLNYWAASCAGGAINGSINGFSVPVAYDGNTGCLCDNNPCGLTSSSTGNFPCGLPGYVYGGNNSMQICVGTGEADPSVCFSRIELVFTYVSPDVITPSITPSGPTSFCPGGSVILNAGSGYSAYNWSTGATTQSITATSTNTYSVSVTSITGCTSGSSSATVTVLSPPIPSITGATNYCTGSSTTLNAGSYSSYIWSTGANTQTINATNANNPITVTVTDGNGCSGSSPAVNVNPLSLPTPSITGTLNYCAGGGTTLNAGGPYSLYFWSNGGNAQTTTVTAANNPVTVTVTDASGCTGTSTGVYVTENTLPTLVITGSLTYCPTSTASLDAGVYSSYLWSTGATSQTITATTANNPITVTVTDVNGCSGSSPGITVSLAANLNPVITGSLTYCTGSSTTLNAGAYSTYLWSTGATSSTISATAANNPISVTVTDASGCSGSSVGISVSETSPPTPSITGNSSYCSGLNTTLSTGIYTAYLWSNGANTQTATVTSANNPISVTVTDASGCTGISTIVNLNEMASPAPTINGLLTYCSGFSTTLNTGAYSSYLWSTGAITQTITATLANNPISVTVTDFNGCTGISSPVNVSIASNVNPSITGTLAYCPGSNTTLSTSIYSAYLWSTGATTQTTTATIANNPVSVTVTDVSGCTGTASVIVSSYSPYTPPIIGTLIYCSSSNTSLTTGLYSSYLWSTGSTSQTTTATIANNPVSVTVTDVNGCPGTSTISVTAYSVQSTLNSLTNADCYQNFTGALSISPSGGITPYTFLWNNGNTTNSLNNLSAGGYTVTITDNNSCQGSFTYTITQPLELIATPSVSNISCYNQNDGLIITSVTGGTAPYQYLWSDSSAVSSIDSLQAGTYSLTITDSHNCNDYILNITITNPPDLIISTSHIDPTFFDSYNGTGTVTVSGGTLPYSYIWSNGAIIQNIAGLTNGLYIVTVTDMNDCFEIDSINIYVPELPLEIPTVFTPNNDKINDDFAIKNIFQFTKVSVEIYNRWGDLLFVFSGTGDEYAIPSNRWDGKHNGKDLPMGSYVYIVIIDDLDPFTGVVSIIR